MKNDKTIYTENSIRTFTGKVFDLKILDPESICIEDIAHALSNTARFSGHLEKMYNVAQHSWLISINVSKKNQLAALLHDASEAYIGDMPSPFKKMMPDYRELEDKLMSVIASKFGFEWPLSKEIKKVDADFLDLEWNCFMMKNPIKLREGKVLEYWSSEKSEKVFLSQFYEIIDKKDTF